MSIEPNYTPQPVGGGPRIPMVLSRRDEATVDRPGTGWRTVTDQATGQPYRVRRIPCGSGGCMCDAEAKPLLDQIDHPSPSSQNTPETS